MKESRYTGVIAAILAQRIGHVRQVLRKLREAGIVPGLKGGDLKFAHLPMVVLGVTADFIKDVPSRISHLNDLPLQSAADLPATAGAMLSRLLAVVTSSPVLGDFDVDDGFLHIGDESIILECLTLSGRRSCIRYGEELPATAATTTTFPISALRELAAIFRSNE